MQHKKIKIQRKTSKKALVLIFLVGINILMYANDNEHSIKQGNFTFINNESKGTYDLYYTPEPTQEKIISFSNKVRPFFISNEDGRGNNCGIYVFDNGSILGILCDISEKYYKRSFYESSFITVFFADGSTGDFKILDTSINRINIILSIKDNHSEVFIVNHHIDEDTKTINVINNKGEYTHTFEFESDFLIDYAKIEEYQPNIYLLHFNNIEYNVSYEINLIANNMRKFSESFTYW